MGTRKGGEFKNHQFESFTQKKGIIHEFSAAYTSEQNGFIERNNKTIVEATRSMLHSRDLPLSLWTEAASTAVFIWNRTVSRQRSDTTPYEQMFNQVPDVSYFRAFGSDAYLHIPKNHRTKLDVKSTKLIFVGYDQKRRAYRLWHPHTKQVSVAVDVVIHETLGFQNKDNMPHPPEIFFNPIDFPAPQPQPIPAAPIPHADLPTSSDRPSVSMPILSDDSNHIQGGDILQADGEDMAAIDVTADHHQRKIVGSHHLPVSSSASDSPANSTSASTSSSTPTNSTSASVSSSTPASASTTNDENRDNDAQINQADNNNIEDNTNQDEDNTSNTKDLGFRLKPRSRHPPLRYGNWIRYDDNRSNTGSAAYIVSQSERINGPKTYKEAIQSTHATQWKEAMEKKFASLMTNKTWVLKPLLEGRKAVKCKWIFKVKYKPSGEVERFKARLVAKGFS